MSAHKPRRRYVPKRIDPDPMGLAMTQAAALRPAQREALMAPLDAAFEAFRSGHGSAAHWCTLADAMNVAEVLAEQRIASDHGETFARAQAALGDVHGRFATTRSWTLRAAEIVALDDATFVHRIQLEHCSQGELTRAIATVKRRVAAALAGNASPGARICVAGEPARGASAA